MTRSQPGTNFAHLITVGLLGWVVPGGGHFLIGERTRGLIIFATIALFAGVMQWNMWYDAMVYVSNVRLHPLQLVLQNVLKQASGLADIKLLAQAIEIKVTVESVQMATLIVATVPILCIYPFVQRYFVKGVMIGAVKA